MLGLVESVGVVFESELLLFESEESELLLFESELLEPELALELEVLSAPPESLPELPWPLEEP